MMALYHIGQQFFAPNLVTTIEIMGQLSFMVEQGAIDIMINGAESTVMIDEKPFANYQTLHLKQGQEISIKINKGRLCYVHFAGKIDIPPELDSLSTHSQAGFGVKKLAVDDRLSFESSVNIAKQSVNILSALPKKIRFCPSAQFDLFPEKIIEQFLHSSWAIDATSNRMAIILQGEIMQLDENLRSIISSPTMMGDIQLAGNKIAVLMADRQMSGGYPRLGKIIEADLPYFAQYGEGEISFELISIEQAIKYNISHATMIENIANNPKPLKASLDSQWLLQHNLIDGIYLNDDGKI